MTNRQILFLLTLSLVLSTIITQITFVQASSDNLSYGDLGFYTSHIIVTTANASQVVNQSYYIGPVYGSGQPYNVVALLNASFQVKLIFIRADEGNYILLNSLKTVWLGNISFYGCCQYTTEPLYLTLEFTSNIISNQSTTLFDLYFSIYSYAGISTSTLDSSLSTLNALGYPYPSRNYRIGLVIIMVGTAPLAIFDQLLKNYLRKRN